MTAALRRSPQNNAFGAIAVQLWCILSCSRLTDFYISSGSTVNICALDLSKAFDKMNHHGLFFKLMQRSIPNNLLLLLERWFSTGMTCVKWRSVWSSWYNLQCGIRQGGVLSPHLFAIYIDSLADKVKASRSGCLVRFYYTYEYHILRRWYFTDSSLGHFRSVIVNCLWKKLQYLDMSVNLKKSACMRIGPRVPIVNHLSLSVAEK